MIGYESFAKHAEAEMSRLEKFLGLTQPITPSLVKSASLSKWKNQLSTDEIEQIFEITGVPPEG